MKGGSWSRLRLLLTAGSLALAVSVALAACGSGKKSSSSASTAAASGSSAASGPGAGKPAVTIGDKNFPEENILGALYAQGRDKVTFVKRNGSTGRSSVVNGS